MSTWGEKTMEHFVKVHAVWARGIEVVDGRDDVPTGGLCGAVPARPRAS